MEGEYEAEKVQKVLTVHLCFIIYYYAFAFYFAEVWQNLRLVIGIVEKGNKKNINDQIFLFMQRIVSNAIIEVEPNKPANKYLAY